MVKITGKYTSIHKITHHFRASVKSFEMFSNYRNFNPL